MSRYRRSRSVDDEYSPHRIYIVQPNRSKSRDRKLDIGFKVLDLFRPRRVVRVVEEPVRRRRRQHIERSESTSSSPSPPRGRRSMSPRIEGSNFVPLPPVLQREPRTPPRAQREPRTPPQHPRTHREHYPGFDVEVVAPRSPGGPEIRRRVPEQQPEIIEVIPSGARDFDRERDKRIRLECELKREKQARQAATKTSHRHYEKAQQLRDRLDRVEDRVQRERQWIRQEFAEQRRDLEITQRERDLNARRLEAEERARGPGGYGLPVWPPVPHGPRPVDLFQEPIPQGGGHDAIRQAQEDARRQQDRHRDDDFFYQNHRPRNPETGRRENITYDDRDARRHRWR